jgi:hypothetical protein
MIHEVKTRARLYGILISFSTSPGQGAGITTKTERSTENLFIPENR